MTHQAHFEVLQTQKRPQTFGGWIVAKMSSWLKGIVKEVLSGDSIVIVGGAKTGIPPEKRLTLSSLIAPKLVSCYTACQRCMWPPGGVGHVRCNPSFTAGPQGKRDGTTKDEPFAWQAREFLRKKLIGQVSVAGNEVCRSRSLEEQFPH